MASADAIDVLVDPANLLTSSVTVPEGLNVDQVVEVLAKGTDFGAGPLPQRARPARRRSGCPTTPTATRGLPVPLDLRLRSQGQAEADMLSAMVDRWEQAAEDADLEGAAEKLGYTPHELMTVASLVEAEGRGDDMPKVARVDLQPPRELRARARPTGLLQIDATVNYALDKSPIARLTLDEIDSVADSPYNTYTQQGPAARARSRRPATRPSRLRPPRPTGPGSST